MTNNKFYQCEKTINGKKYIAQFNGISVALKAIDGSYLEDSSNVSLEKMGGYLLEHVIVEPKGLTIDDFSSMDEFNEVIKFARGVMQGDFRETENKKPTKATSAE